MEAAIACVADGQLANDAQGVCSPRKERKPYLSPYTLVQKLRISCYKR